MGKKGKRVLDNVWDFAKKTIGSIFIIMGLAGLFIPIFPGLLFIFLGAVFLGNKKIMFNVRKIYKPKFCMITIKPMTL